MACVGRFLIRSRSFESEPASGVAGFSGSKASAFRNLPITVVSLGCTKLQNSAFKWPDPNIAMIAISA